MTIQELSAKRQSMIDLMKRATDHLFLLENLKESAKKEKVGEIETTKTNIENLQAEITAIELEIEETKEAERIAAIERDLQAFVVDFLQRNGVSVSNWQTFVDSYQEAVKVMKRAKVKFDLLSDDVTANENDQNANTVASWFSGLSFQQKTCDEQVFNLCNSMTGLRLKTGNVKESLVSYLQSIDLSSIPQVELVKLTQYLINKTTVRKASATTGERGPRSGSVKAQVDEYLEKLGEGTHSLSEYITFFHSVSTGSTKPEAQLTMCCRADKNAKFALSMNKASDQFTLKLR